MCLEVIIVKYLDGGSVLSLSIALGISIFESFFGPRSVLSLMILVQQSNDGGGAYISRAHY